LNKTLVFIFISSYLQVMAEQTDEAGLTPSEKDVIRNTWSLVKKDMTANGVDLFIR
jgi:hypothetical protein